MMQYKISDHIYVSSPTRIKLKPPKHNGYNIYYVRNEGVWYGVMELNGYSRFWIRAGDKCWSAFHNSEFIPSVALELRDVDFAWYLRVSIAVARSIKRSTQWTAAMLGACGGPMCATYAESGASCALRNPLPREVYLAEAASGEAALQRFVT